MQQSSPVSQTFTIDIDKDPQTLYQRFAFVDIIIRSEHFSESLYHINSIPVKRWEPIEKYKNATSIRNINRSVIRQLVRK